MNSTRTPGQQVQDDILKTVQTSQEAVLDAVKAWADAVQSITPKLPAGPPFAGSWPKPEEVRGDAYDLAEQLLANQRKFAEDVLKATAPLMPGQAERRTFSGRCTTGDLCMRQGLDLQPLPRAIAAPA